MHRNTAALTVLVVVLTALIPLQGCGSVDQQTYSRELQELNEKLADRIAGLVEETAELQGGNEEVWRESLAGVLEELVLSLEEGVLELGRVRVPRGSEEAHRSLLHLLTEVAAGYRELAAAIGPHGKDVEGGHQGGETAPHEEAGAPAVGEEETGHAPQAPSEKTESPAGH